MTRATSVPRCSPPALEPAHGATWTAPPRPIDLGELIGRTPRPLDRVRVAEVLKDKRILITGAGGSIGSHLAHVAAEFEPRQIVLMERAENSLFEIDRQLSRRFPGVERRAILHDVVEQDETRRLLLQTQPHVVFHAAAHKHVPLMEDHPSHAVTNNLFGTAAIADASQAAGVERFVMISSDKAVNPSSVMGATKRLAEMYIAYLSRGGNHESEDACTSSQPRTRFSMVRFGNVLGSVGSVLTIWSSQIGDGGPVTITDPRMTRYFMTIPEAAGLVIASSTLDEQPSGAVYVLDMGAPIRIVDLAERFVRAHGYEPRVSVARLPPSPLYDTTEPSLINLVNQAIHGTNPGAAVTNNTLPHGLSMVHTRPMIDIVFTGTRPGEKIHEQLAYAAEALAPTSHEGINSWAGRQAHDEVAEGTADVPKMIEEFRAACAAHDHAKVLALLHRYIPTMPARPE